MATSKGFTTEIGGSAQTQQARSYRIGINTKIIGKTSPDQLSHSSAFIPKSLTLRELAEHCGQKGHPWMPSLLDRGARRYQQHANYAEMLALDIDGGMTIEEAKQHPFISEYCGLGIETASSTPELNKFRLVFPLAAAIQGWRTVKTCTLYLQHLIQVADKACKDASRFYFGSTGREAFILNESASLPESFVADAISWHSEQERIAEEQYREAQRKAEERRSQYGEPSAQEQIALIEQALACIPARTPGSGNYEEWMRILAALVHELGEADAIALVEKFSPSIKGTTWDVARKARSFSRGTARPATLGSVFFYAKQYGFRFPQTERKSCRRGQGFSDSKQSSQSEKSQRDRAIEFRDLKFARHWEGLKKDFQLSNLIEGVEQFEYEGYCPTPDLFWDTIAIQGWLGAGKTEAVLNSLVPFKDSPIVATTPLNGLGRQFQARAEQKGFDARQYQADVAIHRMMLSANQPGMTIMCPDSFKPYAVGRIDWSEKRLVIDEFSGIRKSISSKAERDEFFRAIAECGQLIIADAFLSDADLALVKRIRSGSMALYRQKNKLSSVRVKWLETRNKDGDISYRHDGIAFGLIERWLKDGCRIAIATDSIKSAKVIKYWVEEIYQPGFITVSGEIHAVPAPKVWIACSETPEENAIFMPKPDETIEQFDADVVIYTPTAKSGLDIQTRFDRGLLMTCGVLSPLDMLQMMGRCRKCSEWYVSAPRYSDATGESRLLDIKNLRRLTHRINESFAELGFDAPEMLQAWGLWEDLTKEIEREFNSEYIRSLLEEYFESVETVEVSRDDGLWKTLIGRINDQDAEKRLTADPDNGKRLLDQQKQPSKNSEVWDLKLAQYADKYPKLAIGNAEAFKLAKERGDSERMEDCLKLCITMNTRRAEKLKGYVQAIENNPQDDVDLLSIVRSRKVNHASPAFKNLQHIRLFKSFNLDSLVKLVTQYKDSDDFNWKKDETAYSHKSPIIAELYERFERDRQLKALFPLVETVQDFWGAIKKCFRAFGYKLIGKSARVACDEAKANGKNRDGSPRFSKSESLYFVGIVIMNASGSKYFQENFELIIEAIRDRVCRERDERREWREKHETPPDQVAA